MAACLELAVFCLSLLGLHRLVIVNHFLNLTNLLHIEFVLVFTKHATCTMDQGSLVINRFALLHKDGKIVSLTGFWVFLTLEVLIADVSPVSKAALHDTLDQSNLL